MRQYISQANRKGGDGKVKRAAIVAAILLSPLLIFGLFKAWYEVARTLGANVEHSAIVSSVITVATMAVSAAYLIESKE